MYRPMTHIRINIRQVHPIQSLAQLLDRRVDGVKDIRRLIGDVRQPFSLHDDLGPVNARTVIVDQITEDLFTFAASVNLRRVDKGHALLEKACPGSVESWELVIGPVKCAGVTPWPGAPADYGDLDVASVFAS